MENARPEKVAVVAEVKERLEASEAIVITEYRGLDVPSIAELRTALRAAGGEYKIYKNTLVRLAADELGLGINELLTGPTALAFTAERPDGTAGDAATISRALSDFAKTNEFLVIKGGMLGDRSLTVDDVTTLAKTPPREQLLAEFVGAGESMLQDFAGLLDAKLREFGYAMQELLDRRVTAEGEPPAAPTADQADEAAPAAAEADEAADADEAAPAAADADQADGAEPAEGDGADAADGAEAAAEPAEASDDAGDADAADGAEAAAEPAEASDDAGDADAADDAGDAEAAAEPAEAADETDETPDETAADAATQNESEES